MKIEIEGANWGEIVEQLMAILFFGIDTVENAAVPEGQQTLDVIEKIEKVEKPKKKERKPTECGRCGRLGHNRRTCTYKRRVSSPKEV